MGRRPRQEGSGGGGTRTPKRLRAPHFECPDPDAAGTDESRKSRRLPKLGGGRGAA